MCESVCNVVNEEDVVLAEVGSSEDAVKFCVMSTCRCTQCKCAQDGLPLCCSKKQ